MGPANSASKLWRRRDVIKLLGTTAITGPMILRGTTAKAASSKVIKIGHVSSPTGVFASFAEADPFILDQIRTALGKGISNGGGKYPMRIINQGSATRNQPPPGRARSVSPLQTNETVCRSRRPGTTHT